MLRTVASLCLACLAVLTLSSCFERIQFEEQALQFRYDAEKDELELLLLYRGLQTERGDVQDEAQAGSLTQRMLSKARLIAIGNWPVMLDLDAWTAMAELPQDDVSRPPEGSAGALALEAVAGVEVRAVGLVRDPGHGVDLYQFLRIPKASLLVRALNQASNDSILEASAHPEDRKADAESDADLDAELWARIVEKARNKGDWVTLTSTRLELRSPARPRDVAKLIAVNAKEPNSVLSGFLGALSELETCNGELRATFLADERGRWRMRFVTPQSELHAGASTALAQALIAAGYVVEDEPQWADVRDLIVKKAATPGR